jgi:CRISPR/Cas system-associated protein Csm6
VTPFPQLDAEQEAMAAVLSGCRPEMAPAEKSRLAEEACRILTQIAQVREEIVYPTCVGKAPAQLLDAFVIEEDLIRVLVAEIIQSGPSGLLYDGLIQALKDAVRRRWSEEEGPGGLWSWVSASPGLETTDLAIGDRLRELDQASRSGDWLPLMPLGLETLRTSVPPGATRWTDL